MITDRQLKQYKVADPNVEIYVIKHVDPPEDGYPYIHETGIGMMLLDNWCEADWYETLDEAESHIAETVRDKYMVECIRISRSLIVRGKA